MTKCQSSRFLRCLGDCNVTTDPVGKRLSFSYLLPPGTGALDSRRFTFENYTPC